MTFKLSKLGKDGLGGLENLMFMFFEELRNKQGWRSPKREEIEKVAQRAFLSNDIVLMAYEDEDPACFIRVSTRHEEMVFWVEEIFVRPNFRGRGIARKLVEAAEKEVLERGDVSLYLFVLPQDKNAILFRKSMGYTTIMELVKDLRHIKRDEKLLTLEFLGEKFEIFEWKNTQFEDLEMEYMKLLDSFYKAGGNKKEFLRIVNKALKNYFDTRNENA